ncbi:MAG: integrase core domain-containing protein [Pseudomonadota bacterium]
MRDTLYDGRRLRRLGPGARREVAVHPASKPNQNAFVERFNRSFREEALDAWLFNAISEVQDAAGDGLTDDNAYRPTNPWATCRRWCSNPGCSTGKSLLLSCLLDGGAYARITHRLLKKARQGIIPAGLGRGGLRRLRRPWPASAARTAGCRRARSSPTPWACRCAAAP